VNKTRESEIGKSTNTTLILMLCTALSRLLGFLRVAVIGALFGASGVADVLNTVFAIPNNLRKLLAEGALSSAFIPVLSGSIVRDKTLKKARRLAGNLIGFLLIIFVPFLSLSIIFARPIIDVLLPFPERWKIELSISLFRYLIGYIALVSISSVIMAVLNSHGKFVIPALSPPLFSLCVIGSILIFATRMGIFSVAIGVLSGGVAQIIFQLPLYLKHGYSLKPRFSFGDREFRETLRLWAPVVASASIFAVNQQFALFFASGLEDGSTSALANAIIFWQLPFGIFSISVITVLFPRMSRQSEKKDMMGLRESWIYGVKFIVILLIPTTFIYLVVGREMIQVALQRFKFTDYGTNMASGVLGMYSLGFVSVGIFNFNQRFFYSNKNYRVPLYSALMVSLLDITLSLWLKETSLRVSGLALANSIAFTFGLLFQISFIKKKLSYLSRGRIVLLSLKVSIIMIPIAFFMESYKRLTSQWWTEGSSWSNLFLLLINLFISVVFIMILYMLFKVDILSEYIGAFKARITGKGYEKN